MHVDHDSVHVLGRVAAGIIHGHLRGADLGYVVLHCVRRVEGNFPRDVGLYILVSKKVSIKMLMSILYQYNPSDKNLYNDVENNPVCTFWDLFRFFSSSTYLYKTDRDSKCIS